MGSIFITDFKFGMDRRRMRSSGVAGTLWVGKNVVVGRGGEIERPKAFVSTYSLPAGQTFGLGAVRGQLYTFGSVPDPGVPLGMQYQRLQAPSGAAMVQVLDVRAAGGKMYVIARFADGNIFHFYNGVRVTDWDALGDANCDFNILAQYLAEIISADSAVSTVASGAVVTMTALVPGTPFTVSKGTTDFGGTSDQDITLATVRANVAAVTETRATTSVSFIAGLTGTVSDITINAVSLMQTGVAWATSNTVTAAAVAVQINNKTSIHGYSAIAAAGVITITAATGTGATPNGYAVAGVVTGDVVLNTPSMSGGAAAVAPVAQIVTATLSGTFEARDLFRITLNGVDYIATGRSAGTGVSAYVNKKRLFAAAGPLLEYCKLSTFNNWNDSNVSTGSGFINISNDAEGSERLVGVGTYIQQAAVFTRRNIRVYNISTDAQLIGISQPIDNSGSLSARAIMAYGTTDLLYLDETGVRSLKARDASGAPFVNDIGVAIDTFIRAHLDTLSSAVAQRACAVVEPRDGRYWLALGERIYVLSYFPGSQISAWTYIEPGFSVSDFVRSYNQLYARAGDTVYLYGGASGAVYPAAGELVASVSLPFVASAPPSLEMMLGFDIAAEGAWQVTALFDPDNENAKLSIGTIDGISYNFADAGFSGRTTHIAFDLTCSAAGAAKISNILVHTDGKEPNA